MNPSDFETDKIKVEDWMQRDGIKIGRKEIEAVADDVTDLIQWRSYRSGFARQFRGYDFESYLALSRELFWNSLSTKSDDLKKLELEFSIPFARKEAMDFLAKLVSQSIKPKLQGDNLNALGMRILNGIYKRWAFKNNEKVETFWELLYGVMNGTVCSYIGFLSNDVQRRYLTSFDPETGSFSLKTEKEKYWNDVMKCVVPLEDIYLPLIYERNIQKQGRLIWRTQMDPKQFYSEFGHYKMAKYCLPGNRIADDSLYFKLLGGTGTTTSNKIDVIRKYDWIKDEFRISAGGILLNGLGSGNDLQFAPMPFDHKMAPFTWGIMNPIDEKFAYGLSVPFMVKDPHKILNNFFSMFVERGIRELDPPIITSDLEAPEFIFGQHKVIGVNDINAYKEFTLQPISQDTFTTVNALQQYMSSMANGGQSQVVPSRQPQSARGVMTNQALQQEAMTNALTMYYDILRQRILLVLKTALQFYSVSDYEKGDKAALRTLMVQDTPLSLGGIGDMEIRIVKDKKPDIDLFLEGIKKSAERGKKVEVVEVPTEWLQNVEVDVTDITLEPEKNTDLEKQAYVANVIQPTLSFFVPAGLADPSKTMMRFYEKMGESISDFATDSVLQNMAASMSTPFQANQMNPQKNATAFQGNAAQSIIGTKYGTQQAGPMTYQ